MPVSWWSMSIENRSRVVLTPVSCVNHVYFPCILFRSGIDVGVSKMTLYGIIPCIILRRCISCGCYPFAICFRTNESRFLRLFKSQTCWSRKSEDVASISFRSCYACLSVWSGMTVVLWFNTLRTSFDRFDATMTTFDVFSSSLSSLTSRGRVKTTTLSTPACSSAWDHCAVSVGAVTMTVAIISYEASHETLWVMHLEVLSKKSWDISTHCLSFIKSANPFKTPALSGLLINPTWSALFFLITLVSHFANSDNM